MTRTTRRISIVAVQDDSSSADLPVRNVTWKPMALSATALRYLWDVPMERLTPRGKMARDAFFLSFSLCGMNAVDMWKHKQGRGLQRPIV